uniref:Alkylglycerone-phosphate synthase n=1 Tax=Panagrellus redivivus TaxID=6233 RepID=A0A7E4VL31_PANRE
MTLVQEYNVPRTYRDENLKWNGWGYNDSKFEVRDNSVVLTGDRYELSNKALPLLKPWFEQNLGIDITHTLPSQNLADVKVPHAIDNQNFIDFLRSHGISFSNAPNYRLIRSHGHTVHDMLMLRYGTPDRLPDIVVWPVSENDVEKIVEAANQHDVVIIPIGGGTSVSNALNCPSDEKRTICSLDMSLMNKIIYIDDVNLTCRAQAGIVGQELEQQLNEKGYTCGHEPDSIEFSTLGGWISTRASGMKKNRYGNIEDLLVHVNFVTSKGLIRRSCQVPRLSSGPDIQQIILGSEGTYGVITEATIKLFPLPEVKKYGSIAFPNFHSGVEFFREVARLRIQPASLRLVDNEQFIMGQSLKVAVDSFWKDLVSKISKIYITKWKGFKIDEMCAATCVFEGTNEEVEDHSKKLYTLAEKFGGIAAGEENGRYGYRLTFAIAYLRDLGMEYGALGESFETSVPWDKVEKLCANVKQLMVRKGKELGVTHPLLATCRVTQVYDAGACVYFYLGFNGNGVPDPLYVYDSIEVAARDEIIACGGSISHHHGIGKLRKQWLPATIGEIGVSLLQSIKNEIDPKNVFANNNLVDTHKSKL